MRYSRLRIKCCVQCCVFSLFLIFFLSILARLMILARFSLFLCFYFSFPWWFLFFSRGLRQNIKWAPTRRKKVLNLTGHAWWILIRHWIERKRVYFYLPCSRCLLLVFLCNSKKYQNNVQLPYGIDFDSDFGKVNESICKIRNIAKSNKFRVRRETRFEINFYMFLELFLCLWKIVHTIIIILKFEMLAKKKRWWWWRCEWPTYSKNINVLKKSLCKHISGCWWRICDLLHANQASKCKRE